MIELLTPNRASAGRVSMLLKKEAISKFNQEVMYVHNNNFYF
jgi:hypothetical protein